MVSLAFAFVISELIIRNLVRFPDYGVEYFSVMRAIEAVDRSDVVVLVLAADEEISEQEVKIASYARRKMKEIIVVFNKWDLVEKNSKTTGKYIGELYRKMPFLQFAPVLFISAKTGQRINRIMETVVEIEQESEKRIPTSELNRFLQTVVEKHPPTHRSGKEIKIYYVTQAGVKPPTFVFFCKRPATYIPISRFTSFSDKLKHPFAPQSSPP